jgi:hypothetical protein
MKTINEQIKRIKSLFGNERLYGNLNESLILNEQGIGRKLAKSLPTAVPLLKIFDSKLLTNFFETEIRNFDDLAKHLNDYENIWAKVLPADANFNFIRNMTIQLARIERNGNLSTLSEETMNRILRNIPIEGDLRKTYMDMWLESTGKTVDKTVDVRREVVTDPKSGENILKVTDANGGVKSYGSDGKEIKIDGDVSTPKKLDGDEIGEKDVLDNTVATTDKLDPNGKPDVNNGELIRALESALIKLKKLKKLKITLKQLKKQISENGAIIFIKGKDGKYYSVTKIEDLIITLDEGGKIISIKKIGETDTTPTSNFIGNTSRKFGNTKNIDYSNMDKSFGGMLRYLLPLTSQIVKTIRFIFKGIGGKGFTTRRFTFFKGGTGDIGKDLANYSLRQFENTLRLGEEQLFLAYIYGSYKKFERDEESPLSISDYGNKLIDYSTIYVGIWENITGVAKSIKDSFVSTEAISQFCKNDCEKKGIPSSEVNKSSCLKECSAKFKKELEKIDLFMVSVESLPENIKKLKKLEDYDDAQIEKFCSNEDGEKEEIMNSLRDFKEGLVDYENHLDSVGDFNVILNFLGLETGGKKEILDKLLTPSGEKERITLKDVEGFEETIGNFCTDYYNKDVNPNAPIENKEEDKEEDSGIEDRMVYINVSIIPIELTGDDVA